MRRSSDAAALADAGDADECEELRRPVVSRTFEGVTNYPELALTTAELRACLARDVHAEARASGDGLQTGIGSVLPLASTASAGR